MSAKSTVTCLRSPSREPLEVRILSARYLGVYDSGEFERAGASAVPATAVPQREQNRDSGGRTAPHAAQL